MDPVKELDEYHPNERNEKALIVKDLRPRPTEEETPAEQPAESSSATPTVTESTAETQPALHYPAAPLDPVQQHIANQMAPTPVLDIQGSDATELQAVQGAPGSPGGGANGAGMLPGGAQQPAGTPQQRNLQYLTSLPKNYRTVPCKNYHGPNGCSRRDYCHFIHVPEYQGQEIPKEVFYRIR